MPWPGVEVHLLPDGGRRFELADSTLAWVRVDYQVRLQFGKAELVIETSFTLTAEGSVHHLDPDDRAGLGPILGIYPDAMAALSMTPDGTLHGSFESGAQLVVPPSPSYEAWSIGGFWCVPGGFV